MRASGTAPTA
ncbi:hypothetical protein LEMLEM_LOCUS10953 [Lemmus lemmus]